jgi:hypothetical protein
MLDFYLAEVRRARTDNMIQAVHHTLENELAPAEFEQLARDIEASGIDLPPVCHAWIDRMRRMLRVGAKQVRMFVRQPLVPGATYYTAAPGTETQPRRTLVVAFAGDAHRLMSPIAAFLQHLDPARYEMLLLFDASRSMFLRGIPGIAPDFGSMLAWIDEQRRARGMPRTIALGTSAGGLAAVWTALALGLDRAVSIGGTTPVEVVERYQTLDVDISGFDEVIRRRAGAGPEVAYVYGELCDRDRGKAEELAARLPVTLVPLPRLALHNVIFETLRRRTLAALIELVFGERSVAEAMRDPACQAWAE